MTSAESIRELLGKSSVDLPEGAESGTGPDPATPHQAHARLMRGRPSMACGRSELIQAFLGADTHLVNNRERRDPALVLNIANPDRVDFVGMA
jgi:hypothetical protein